jgi:hypothetical protein
MIQNLDIPWAQWGQDLLQGVEGLGVWLGRYIQYLGQAEAYLSANFPGSNLLNEVEQGLANIDPNLNLTNVTYGELVADSSAIYAQFVSWYGTFFGSNGLIQLSVSEIQDGGVVYRFNANLTSLNLGLDVVDVERPNILPIQFESIAEWISTKFGSVILANSCALCAAGNGTVVVPPNNSTNSSGNGTSVVNNTGNGTSVVNNTNGTIGGNNSTNGTGVVIGGNNSTNGTVGGSNSTSNGTLPVGGSNSTTTNSTSSSNSTTPVTNSSSTTTSTTSTGPTP